jgi:coatomer subunit beta'
MVVISRILSVVPMTSKLDYTLQSFSQSKLHDCRTVKIWDYQNKSCVQTLSAHTNNISAVCFHPELPIIVSAAEDGTVRIWHSNTYRLENTLNYGFERAWALCYMKGSNHLGFGYDEGAVVIKVWS